MTLTRLTLLFALAGCDLTPPAFSASGVYLTL